MTLQFVKASKEADIREVCDYNIDAFSDSPDFKWNLEEILKEIKDGWELFSVNQDGEIIAAVFIKEDGGSLLSKNTSVKMEFQGSGHSHEIKEYIEKEAKGRKLKKIVHYCRIDNFRMYSLNESHDYKKTKKKLGEDGQLVEWIKVLK